MSRAGFILVGGASTRMGRDKAMLPDRGATLVEHIAATVVAAAGNVVLVGNPEKYSSLGYPVVPDPMDGAGPLAGLCAALTSSDADWNLVLACDMPGVSAGFLRALLDAAERTGADALLPAGPSGRPEPLCAVYHQRSLPVIRQALENGVRRVLQGLEGLSLKTWQVSNPEYFENCNTPQEWFSVMEDRSPDS